MDDIHVCPECGSEQIGPDEESPDGVEWSCLMCGHVFAGPEEAD